MNTLRFLLASATLLASSSAFARADIEVQFSGPASAEAYQTQRYSVAVNNVGNRTASDVMLYIQLPETATSPQVHVMGVLGAFSGDCAILNDTILECDLGRIRRNRGASVFFDLALPAKLGPAEFIAEARTSTREDSTANNAVAASTAVTYIDTPIQAPALATNRHCTGTDLTAFYECTLYPSSISSHQITLNAGGSISFANAPATFSGAWSQPTPDQLYFVYYDDGAPVAAFRGGGVGGNCFEGLTVFPGSQYVAPYEVCL